MTFSCSHQGCDFTTDSKVGLGVHKSRSHNLDKFKDVVCSWCSNNFEKRRSEVERSNKHFCDKRCHKKWRSTVDFGNAIVKECSFCEDDVTVYQSEKNKYERHFCNIDCHSNWQSENKSNKNSHRYKERDTKCDECGELFYRRPSRSDGKNFCSKVCEGKNRRVDNSCNSYGSNWSQKREETLDRDGYKCKVCDISREEHYQKYGRDLGVHHKVPIAEFDEPEDANYLINLVTTCRSCHGELDTISRREADRKPTISV